MYIFALIFVDVSFLSLTAFKTDIWFSIFEVLYYFLLFLEVEVDLLIFYKHLQIQFSLY